MLLTENYFLIQNINARTVGLPKIRAVNQNGLYIN